jgi:folate-binding protein YgfZ
MNIEWTNFLVAHGARIDTGGGIVFPVGAAASGPATYPLTHLSVLTVAGNDAAKFLQGQCTCDINGVTAAVGSIGAFCNAKGRAVATALILKKDDDFLIVLPAALADTVKNRLSRYILRAAVTITDNYDDYCLIGIEGVPAAFSAYPLPQNVYGVFQADGDLLLHLPVSPPRYLLLAASSSAPAHWETLCDSGFQAADTTRWCSRDIEAGIPWLDAHSSEQFIPQMLNLDHLGGIGFSKGCYTGQEVVARTQYLGSVKRRMYYGECAPEASVAADSGVVDIDAGTASAVGDVLAAQRGERGWQLLVVMQTSSAASKNLRLQNLAQDKIIIKRLSYVTETAD